MDALLTRLIANPDDLDALRVCADLLLERGDPRGELMAVQCERRLCDRPALVDLEHALIWHSVNPQMTERLQMRSVSYAWRLGFLESITFQVHGDEPFEAIPKLASEPAARLLRRMVISAVQLDGQGELSPAFAQLKAAAAAFPLLEDIRVEEGANLGNPWIEGPIRVGDCAPLFAGSPGMVNLALHGKEHRLGEIVLPKLRTFAATDLPVPAVAELARARWPKLTSLELTFALGPLEDPEDAFARCSTPTSAGSWRPSGSEAEACARRNGLRMRCRVGLQRPRAPTGFAAR